MVVKELIRKDEELRNKRPADMPVYDLGDLPDTLPYYDVKDMQTPYVTVTGDAQYSPCDPRAYNERSLDDLYDQYLAILPPDIRKHIVIAGGAVFQAAYHKYNTPVYFSDIDIFLHHVRDEAHGKDIVRQVITIYSDVFKPQHTTRSASAVTISNFTYDGVVPVYTDRIQVILRLYENVQQLLYGFDMQCAALAMVGHARRYKVLGTELAMFTHATGKAVVDTGRRSLTFSRRIKKYMNRGIQFIFPYLNPVDTANEFGTTNFYISYRRNQDEDEGKYELHQTRSYILLNDCALVLRKRIGPSLYEGTMSAHSYVSNTTGNSYPYMDGMRSLSAQNVAIINSAIENEQSVQPDLYLPIRGDVTKDINIASQPIGVMGRTLVRLSSSQKQRIQFEMKYRLKFRVVNPGSQWTSSFDPIIGSVAEWYGEKYYANVSLADMAPNTYLMSSVAAGRKLFVDKLVYSEHTKVPEIEAQPQYNGDIIVKTYLSCVAQNLLREDKDKFTIDDFEEIILQLAKMLSPSVNLKDLRIMEDDWLSLNVLRRHNMVNEWRSLRTFATHFNNFVQGVKARKQLQKLRDAIVKPKVFKWQDMCTIMSKVSINQLRRQAEYFQVDPSISDDPDVTRRQLCAAISEKADQYMAKFVVPCANPEDYDLLMATQMKDIPPMLKWYKTGANGMCYCYNLIDMYKSVLAGVRRDPKGNELTREDIVTIIERAEFMQAVLTTVESPDVSLMERLGALNIQNVAPRRIEDLASDIVRLIDHSPLQPRDLVRLSISHLNDIINMMEEHANLRASPMIVDPYAALERILDLIVNTPSGGVLAAAAFGDFVTGNGLIIDEMRSEADRADRARLRQNSF